MRSEWRKWQRWLLRAAVLGLLLAWSLTWALDAPLRPTLAERANIAAAAVQVSGTACGQYQDGTGFAVEPGLVITNAHVVAGIEQIKVSMSSGGTNTGVLVGFDPGRDIAAISVPGWGNPPVALAPAVAVAGDVGDVATVDSEDGVEFVPFAVTRWLLASGVDVYGEGAENRQVLEIRSLLAAGDSGSALVNAEGEVWGMVFAVARGQRDQGYALDHTEIGEFLAEIDRTPLPTPPCRTR